VAANAQKRRRGLIAIVAAVIATGAFLLILTTRTDGSNGPQAQAPTTTVAVTSADVKPGDQLSSTNIALQPYPTANLPVSGSTGTPVFFTDTSSLLSSPHYASVQLPKGALIISSQLASSAGAAHPAVGTVVDLQSGDVALSVPYDLSKGAGGYVQAEDRIDIVIDDPATGTVRYAFQDVRIIHVGSSADQATTGAVANLLLIELARQKAATLSYLIDHQATIRYLLRPRGDFKKGDLPNSSPVTTTNWQSFLDG
jgi:Flp pilus assembly protein CpaB